MNITLHSRPFPAICVPLAACLAAILCACGGEQAGPAAPEPAPSPQEEPSAAPVAAQERISPWTPDRLDTGADLSVLTVASASPVGPAAATTPIGPPAASGPSEPAAPTGPVGHIAWEEGAGVHDFGPMVQGESREHRFEIVNDGEGDLVIQQIRPSCGCTVAQTSVVGADGSHAPYQMGSPIPVGTRLSLECKLDTSGKRGNVASAINIYSNDPRNLVSLQLKAEVTPVLSIEPNHLNFQQISASDTVEGSMTVTSGVVEGFGLELLDPERMPEALKVELTPIDPDAEGHASSWEVKVVLGPGVKEGAFSHGLRLSSDIALPESAQEHLHNLPEGQEPPAHSEFHQLNAFVMAQVMGLISANPYYISFGLVRPGQVVVRSVRVSNHDPDFEFLEPATSLRGYQGDFEHPDAVSVQVRQVPDESAWDVEVTLDGLPEDLNASFRGMVQIAVGHPTKPQVEIPFSGVSRSGVGAPTPVPPGAGVVPGGGGR